MTITSAAPVGGPPRGDSLPEVATRAEVSEFIRVPVATIARWAVDGKGPRYRRAGSKCLYMRDDVLAWLDSLGEAF